MKKQRVSPCGEKTGEKNISEKIKKSLGTSCGSLDWINRLPRELISVVASFLDLDEVRIVTHSRDRALAGMVKRTYLHRNFHYLTRSADKRVRELRPRLLAWMEVNDDWRDLYGVLLDPRAKDDSRNRAFLPLFCNLSNAVMMDMLDIVRHLIEVMRCDVNKPRHFGACELPPLEVALSLSNTDTLEYLLGVEGIDVNVKVMPGECTPLHRAAVKGKERLRHLQLLLSRDDLDVDAADNNGLTALHHVCCLMPPGAATIARLLLDAGANPSARSAGGFTPLDIARCKRNKNIVRLLVDAGGLGRDDE